MSPLVYSASGEPVEIPYVAGDIVTVVLHPGEEIQVLVDVELEQRFDTPNGVVWRGSFVGRIGSVNVAEQLIQGFQL